MLNRQFRETVAILLQKDGKRNKENKLNKLTI